MSKKTRRELIEEYGKVSAVIHGKRITLETGKGHKIELSFFNSIKYSILSKISVLFNNSVQSLLHKQYKLYDDNKPK